jgi:MYXO-CTERM domain-containing protein
VPGYFYGDALFDVAVDNIRMQPLAAVPEAPGAALMAAGLLGLAGAARLSRRRRARIA